MVNRETVFNKEGFTLVEVLIVTAIFAVFASAMFGLYRSQNDAYAIQNQVVDMQQSLRGTMGLITKELRMAGFDPSGKAGATIETAREDSIYFTKDVKDPDDVDNDLNENEADGKLDGYNEHVAFCLSNGQICHHSGTDASHGSFAAHKHESITLNASQLTFTYFDENGNQINPDPVTLEVANPQDIRSVEIQIQAATSFKGQTHNRTLTATVFCRNMGL